MCGGLSLSSLSGCIGHYRTPQGICVTVCSSVWDFPLSLPPSLLPLHPSLPPSFLLPDRVRMSSVEEVPFKIPLGGLGEVQEEADLITAPDITLPDYLTILQETEVSCRHTIRHDRWTNFNALLPSCLDMLSVNNKQHLPRWAPLVGGPFRHINSAMQRQKLMDGWYILLGYHNISLLKLESKQSFLIE